MSSKKPKNISFTCLEKTCNSCGVCTNKKPDTSNTRTRKLSRSKYKLVQNSEYNMVMPHLEPPPENYIENFGCRISGGNTHKRIRKQYTKKKNKKNGKKYCLLNSVYKVNAKKRRSSTTSET